MDPDIKRPLFNRALWTAGAASLIAVVAYLVVTSSWFAESLVLPRVAAARGFEAKAGNISVSLFNGIRISNLAASRTDNSLAIAAKNLRIKAPLWHLAGDSPTIKALDVQGLSINAVIDETPSRASGETRPRSGRHVSPPRKFSIENLDVNDGSLSLVFRGRDGLTNRSISVADITIELDDLMPGSEAVIDLSGTANLSTFEDGQHGTLGIKIDQRATLGMGAGLSPRSVELDGAITTTEAGGFLEELSGIRVESAALVEENRIRKTRLAFFRGATDLGSISLDGPVDLSKREARLRVRTSPITGDTLDLFARPFGLDADTEGVTFNGTIEFARGGSFVTIGQKIHADMLGLETTTGRVAPFDLDADILLNYNRLEDTLLVRTFDLAGEQRGHKVISTSLDRPMNLAFGAHRPGFKEATLSASFTGLDLSDWSAFFRQWLPTGRLSADASLTSARDGGLLSISTSGSIRGISSVGDNMDLDDGIISFAADTRISDLRLLEIGRAEYSLNDASGEIVKGDGGGQFDLEAGAYTLRTSAKIGLAPAAKVAGMPRVEFQSGTASISQLLKSDASKRSISGSVFISGATGSVLGRRLSDRRVNIDNQLELSSDTLRIRRLGLTSGQGTTNGGGLDIEATLDTDLRTGSARIQTLGLNRVALAPLLDSLPAFAPIDHFSLTSDVTLQILGGDIHTIRGEAELTKLTLTDGTSLDLALAIDAGREPGITRIAGLDATWRHSEKSPDETSTLGITGSIPPSSSTNSADLKLEGGDCDFTRLITFAQAYLSERSQAEMEAARSNVVPPSRDTVSATAPTLPRGTMDVSIDRAVYRDLWSTNLTSRLELAGGRLGFQSAKMNLNGKPLAISATVSLDGSRAFKVGMEGRDLPLNRLASTFAVGPSQPAAAGMDVSAALESSGGSGGINLPVSGTVHASFRDAEYAVADPKYAALVDPVLTLLKIPDLRTSSISDGGISLLLNNGVADIRKLSFENRLFNVATTGSIGVRTDWRTSPVNLPLEISLERSVAERIGMKADDGEGFVVLPRFASVSGTIGDPFTRIDNKAGLLRLGIKVFQDEIPDKYHKEAEIVKDVLKVLDPDGRKGGGDFNPLDLFRKVLPR